MSRVKPGRARLTWEEIVKIETYFTPHKGEVLEGIALKASQAVKGLVRHIRFISHEHASKQTKFQHFCPDWDFMEIKPSEQEMEVCTCDFSPAFLWDMIGKMEVEINELRKESKHEPDQEQRKAD